MESGRGLKVEVLVRRLIRGVGEGVLKRSDDRNSGAHRNVSGQGKDAS